VKDHGQCSTPMYRLLCGGGGWCWVQTKACLILSRRGSNKPDLITCTTHQVSEVINSGEILALIQMTNGSTGEKEIKKEKENAKELDDTFSIDQMIMTAAAEFYFASEDKPIMREDSTALAKTQSVIIEPREAPKIKQRSSVISCAQGAAPTPVIVRRKDIEPKAVTEMTFSQNEMLISQENEPKAVTEMLFSQQNECREVTEMLFSKKNEPKAVTEMLFYHHKEPKAVTEMLFSTMKTEKGEDKSEENNFFDELFSNLEQIDNFDYLAPYAGDAHIPLNTNFSKKLTPSSSPSSSIDEKDSMDKNEDLDNTIILRFDENFVQLSDDDRDKPNPGNNVFLNPDKNLMWSNCGGTNFIKKPRIQIPDPAPPPSDPGFMIDGDDLKQFLGIHINTSSHVEEQIRRVTLSTPPHHPSLEKCTEWSPGEEIFFVPKQSEKEIF